MFLFLASRLLVSWSFSASKVLYYSQRMFRSIARMANGEIQDASKKSSKKLRFDQRIKPRTDDVCVASLEKSLST